jgi:hypothetical protein
VRPVFKTLTLKAGTCMKAVMNIENQGMGLGQVVDEMQAFG